MSLALENVTKRVGGEIHVRPTDLTLERGTMNVLLGPTLAGKTTLMRLMAGLEQPTGGRVLWQGEDVTGVRVRNRDVAMVYQQFINYPAMSVYDNIASPLRLRGVDRSEVDRRVRAAAEFMRLDERQLGRRPPGGRRTGQRLRRLRRSAERAEGSLGMAGASGRAEGQAGEREADRRDHRLRRDRQALAVGA